MAEKFSVRLSPLPLAALDREALRLGLPRSQAAARAIERGLRREDVHQEKTCDPNRLEAAVEAVLARLDELERGVEKLFEAADQAEQKRLANAIRILQGGQK